MIRETGVSKIIQLALEEDAGRGDITGRAVVPGHVEASGYIITREKGVIAGLDVVEEVFFTVDPGIQLEKKIQDGETAEKDSILAVFYGNAQSILLAERTALNFLQRLSGIATVTAGVVQKIMSYEAVITDTRKTTPGMRVLEKYAVTAGGGKNHRFGLDDAVIIKDNHIKAAGGLAEAIKRALKNTGHTVKIEVEVETPEEAVKAVEYGAEIVMLDNMSTEEMKKAVGLIGKRAIVEASGGISPETVQEVAAAGVDVISLGWITHSARPLDISLEFEQEGSII